MISSAERRDKLTRAFLAHLRRVISDSEDATVPTWAVESGSDNDDENSNESETVADDDDEGDLSGAPLNSQETGTVDKAVSYGDVLSGTAQIIVRHSDEATAGTCGCLFFCRLLSLSLLQTHTLALLTLTIPFLSPPPPPQNTSYACNAVFKPCKRSKPTAYQRWKTVL